MIAAANAEGKGAFALEGKRAFVTGAGSEGIGRAVALALHRVGARVAVHDHGPPGRADALARALGTDAAIEGDFSDASAARAAVSRADEKLDGLDILVHCAAMLKRVPFLDLSDEDFRHVSAVNLAGSFSIAQEAARRMLARGRGGRIILISSVNQQKPSPDLAHYAAAKGGVMMLARSMALELAPHAITVNLIAPGTVETDINRGALSDADFRAGKERLVPLHRIADPEDVAGAAVYLASDAASYVTGSTLVVDGGLTL